MPAEKPLTEDRLKAARELWPEGQDSGWMPLSVREWVAMRREEPAVQTVMLLAGAEAFMRLRLAARTPDNRNWLDGVYGVLKDVPASDFEEPPDARIADLEREKAALERRVADRICATCEGGGVMDVVVRVEPPDGQEVYETVECAECCGTGVGAWGQAEKQRDALAAGLSDALEALADMSGFVETRHYAEKYGVVETMTRLRALLPTPRNP